MKEEITIKAVNLKLVLIWIVFVSFAVGLIALIAGNFKNTTNQTMFIIFSLSVIIGGAYLFMREKIRVITFIFDNSFLKITEKKIKTEEIIKETETPYSEIENFNIYNSLIIKKFGYTLRIKSDKNYFYCVGFIGYDNNELLDITGFDKFLKFFSEKNIMKKNLLIDKILLTFSYLPLIIIILGIAVFIGAFYYTFFMK